MHKQTQIAFEKKFDKSEYKSYQKENKLWNATNQFDYKYMELINTSIDNRPVSCEFSKRKTQAAFSLPIHFLTWRRSFKTQYQWKPKKKKKHNFNTHLLQTSKKLTLLAPPYSHSNKINKGWELEVEFGMREREKMSFMVQTPRSNITEEHMQRQWG